MAGTADELFTAFDKLAPVSVVLFNSCDALLADDELTGGLLADDAVISVTGALLAIVDAFAELVATSRVGLVASVVASFLLATELVTTSTLGMSVAFDVIAVAGLLFAVDKLLFMFAVIAGELLEFKLIVAVVAVVLTLSGSFLTKSLLVSGVSEDIARFSDSVQLFVDFLLGQFDRLQFK